MRVEINRRQFLTMAALSSMVTCTSTRSLAQNCQTETHPARFFFTTQGKTAMMNTDGSGLRYFEFDEPNQATWQPGLRGRRRTDTGER